MHVIKYLSIGFLLIPAVSFSQFVGIGVENTNRAFLEVNGVAGSGRTAALFGGQSGISFQRDVPAIGFNQYNDDATPGALGRYMSNGYAAVVSYAHNSLSNGLAIDIYPYGNANTPLLAGKNVFRFTGNGKLVLSTEPSGGTGGPFLDAGRITGVNATALLLGTSYHSSFNNGAAEHTTIRAGKSGSTVRINDANTGNVYFGYTSGTPGTRVGINSTDPQYSFEIRQVANTGLKMVNNTNHSWEWRVGYSGTLSGVNTSLAHFYALYNGTPKAYFAVADGSLLTISDSRLKNNVNPLPTVMDKVLQLAPVTYEMIRDNPDHTRSMGFIAQDVAPLFPQIAVTNAPDEIQLLQYSGFGVIAIKGVQEQQQKIDGLHDKMADIERLLKAAETKFQSAKTKH